MGQLVLLVVAAAWAAVLIPPLLRSRIENRPNSSVTDFRNQLSSLQRAMPSRSVGPIRGMARPLAPSPLSRPAASGRPAVRSGVRTHGGARAAAHPVRHGRTAPPARMHDASSRSRSRRERSAAEIRSRRQETARELHVRDALKRRRANVLLVLVLVAASSLFLAATTKATGMLYVFALAFMALCGYLYLLGQFRQREELAPAPVAPPVRRPAPPSARRAPAPREALVRREPMARRDRSYAV